MTVVSPLVGTESLWAVALAALVLGRSEMIGRRIAVAAVLVAARGRADRKLALIRCISVPSGNLYFVKEKKHTVRRTSLNLDFGLVDEARSALGTNGTTETIHAALREIILRERRRRLTERDFSMLTPELLEELRRPQLERE